MKTKLMILSAASIFLTSCAAFEQMRQESIKEHCNSNAAYNAGLTDGLTPQRTPDQNYASGYVCPEAGRDSINSSYLKGFTEGLKSRPQEITINKNVNVKDNSH